jgi:transcriptional regulator with GAF, ATPase, and Fis domain
MSNDSDTSSERWYGALETAQDLGMHRSTLHLAISRDALVPDRLTPGGHARFCQETLDRFKTQMQRAAATSEKNPVASLSAIARITSGISVQEPAKDICQVAVESIRHAQPGIDGVAIVLVDREKEPPELRWEASVGLSARFIAEYERLYARHVELAMTRVLQTLEPEIVPDTAQAQLPFGSNRLTHVESIRSYAVFPLLQGQHGLGALLLTSHTPHRFTNADRAFLRSVANILALAVRIDLYRNGPFIPWLKTRG